MYSRDPDDNKFISCAVEAEAEFIVTKDKHLLDVGQYGNVQIVKPGYLVERVLSVENAA
jgi:uncharacterized protein